MNESATPNLLDAPAPAEIVKYLREMVNHRGRDKFPQADLDKLDASCDSHFTMQRVYDLLWRAGDDCKELSDYCRKNKFDNPEAWFAEDILGDFGFRIIWGVQDHWVNFVVFAIKSRLEDRAGFDIAGRHVSGDIHTEDISQADPYLKGSIKWDGCSDIHFGHHHWCGPGYWAKHALLMQYLFTQAFIRMRRDAEDEGMHWQLDMNKSPAAMDSDGFRTYQTPVAGTEILGIDTALLRDAYKKAEYP